MRLLGETISKSVLASNNIREAHETRQVNRLNIIKREGLTEREILDILHMLRRKGYSASDKAGYGTIQEAKQLLELAYQTFI